jgi:pyruvate/2-oxoglutarate dehydrogenase complex dihydrolipoamide acyltransferase (E2) component
MSLEQRLSVFADNHDLDKDAIAELLQIWNVTLVDVAHGLLKETPNQPSKKSQSKQPEKTKEKKWASKAASEYAEENDITLDDFDSLKISKKDVEEYIKKKAKPVVKEKGESSKDNGKKIKCHGLTKKGDPCNRNGTSIPDGAKFSYCFRHADDYRDFEVSDDSSDEEELSKEAPVPEVHAKSTDQLCQSVEDDVHTDDE